MATQPDLNKLRSEIDNRKRQKSNIGSDGVAPRDAFLHGLLQSRNTGAPTQSTNLIKLVENKTAIKQGEKPTHNISETDVVAPLPTRQPVREGIQNGIPLNNNMDLSQERDEQLFRDMETKRKQTLAESIAQYVNPQGGYPNYPANGYPNMPNAVPPMNLNEGYLVENVKKIVDNYLIENFGPVIEEAIKSTMLEIYAVGRIKEVLQENKEIVKAVVIETIREIQAKSKATKAQQ